MQIFGFLGSLLGYVLWGAFYLLKDFGLSIIVFTIIVRPVSYTHLTLPTNREV